MALVWLVYVTHLCWPFFKNIKQGFSNCESRKKFLGSRNKLAFCAFKIGFSTIVYNDNQKLEKIKCHYLNLLKICRHSRHLIDKIKPESERRPLFFREHLILETKIANRSMNRSINFFLENTWFL